MTPAGRTLGMDTRLREEPDVYEEVLHAWTAFAVRICEKRIMPNRLETGRRAGLVLVYRVGPREAPIRCRDGERVRFVKLVFTWDRAMTPH